jgi:hypothetical protein
MKDPGTGGAMLRWYSAQRGQAASEGDARSDRFEMLKDYILVEYYRQERIEGWKLSEMERPDRKTVLRLIRYFLNEA